MLTDERIPEQLQNYFEWLDEELGPIEPISRLMPEAPMWRATADARRPNRHRITVFAACVVLAVGAIVAIGAVAGDGTDDAASPPSIPSDAASPEVPAWHRAIRPFLPPGFEHITVQESHDRYAKFIALDPVSGKTLHLTVTRSAMPADPDGSITLEQAMNEPWTDVGADLNVSLPDGRQVGVACGFRAMPQGSPGCPTVNGQVTDPDDLRKLAVALATEVDVADFPAPAPTLEHVPTETIRSAIKRVANVPEFEVVEHEAPHYSTSFIQFHDVSDPEFVVVNTQSGYYPALPTDSPRRSGSVDGYRLTWQVAPDGAVWFVSDHPDSPGIDIADEILDVAVGAAGAVPDAVPEGFSIWSITATGSSGSMLPSDPDVADGAAEIHWDVGWNELVAREPDDDTLELADGTLARYRTEPYGYQLATWQQESGSWISVVSMGDAIERDEFVDLASSFTTVTPDEIARLRAVIATNVRATLDQARTATIDGATIELYTLDDAPTAMCISADRCEVALDTVGGIEPNESVVGFNFQNADGSADYYGLVQGSFGRLEPSEGVTISTQPDADGTWVHAHRPADVPYGSVTVVNPSEELGGIVGFQL